MLFLNKNDRLRSEIKGGGLLKNSLNIFKKGLVTPEYKEEVKQLGLHNKADIKRFLNKLDHMEKEGINFIKKVEQNGQFGGSKKSRKSKKQKVIKRISKNMNPITKNPKKSKKKITKRKTKGGNYYFPEQGAVFLGKDADLANPLSVFDNILRGKSISKTPQYTPPKSNYNNLNNSAKNIRASKTSKLNIPSKTKLPTKSVYALPEPAPQVTEPAPAPAPAVAEQVAEQVAPVAPQAAPVAPVAPQTAPTAPVAPAAQTAQTAQTVQTAPVAPQAPAVAEQVAAPQQAEQVSQAVAKLPKGGISPTEFIKKNPNLTKAAAATVAGPLGPLAVEYAQSEKGKKLIQESPRILNKTTETGKRILSGATETGKKFLGDAKEKGKNLLGKIPGFKNLLGKSADKPESKPVDNIGIVGKPMDLNKRGGKRTRKTRKTKKSKKSKKPKTVKPKKTANEIKQHKLEAEQWMIDVEKTRKEIKKNKEINLSLF